MLIWNPWHGCHKISQGCKNCYVYSKDSQYQKDSSIVTKTLNFDLPIRKNLNGEYKLTNSDEIGTCLTSDFFVEEADKWRSEVWNMIKQRYDLTFFIITKRIDRFYVGLPDDWKDGYDNVLIYSTVENQSRADYLLTIFIDLPIKYKGICCSPILERIDFSQYLRLGKIAKIIVGGESGQNARICDYDWVLDIRNQCAKSNVKFFFQQTGALMKKGNKIYHIDRKYQHSQAKKADINIY